MGTFIALMLLVTGIILQRHRRSWIAPDVFFCYEWALITFMASLSLFSIYKADDFTWIIVFIGCFSFIAGVQIVLSKQRTKHAKIINDTGIPFFNIPTFWIIYVFILFSTYIDFEYTLSFIEQGYTLGQIKHAMSTGDTSVVDYERGSGAIYRITKVVYPGFRLLVSAVGIHYFIKGVKWSFLYLFAILFLTILESFTSGGRLQVFQLIMTLFVCYSLVNSRKKKYTPHLSKATIFISIGVLVFVIFAVSMARGWEEGDFSEKYYRYLCGNIALLDHYLSKITESTPYYLIWNSFNGLWGIIFPVLHFIFRIPKPDIYQNALKKINVTQEDIQVAPDAFMNAYTTPYYFLYADARIPGVIIGMLLFGLFCGKIYSNVKENMIGRNVTYYVIVSHMIFQTLISYPFTYSSYTFIVIFFFFYKKETMNIIDSKWFKHKGIITFFGKKY